MALWEGRSVKINVRLTRGFDAPFGQQFSMDRKAATNENTKQNNKCGRGKLEEGEKGGGGIENGKGGNDDGGGNEDGEERGKDEDGEERGKDEGGEERGKDEDGEERGKDEGGEERGKDEDGEERGKDEDGEERGEGGVGEGARAGAGGLGAVAAERPHQCALQWVERAWRRRPHSAAAIAQRSATATASPPPPPSQEDMEKVNIHFNDNGTVSFQHHKILTFVPELSLDKNLKVTVPNIPLLTLSTMSNSLMRVLQTMLSMFLRTMNNMTPFVHVSVDELLFGYDDTLVALANRFFPAHKRPASRMGLLLSDVQTIFTGHTSMSEFGYMSRLNGRERLPFWDGPPCDSLRASEGSFFPPRRSTHSDIVHVWDKDLCRIWPLQRQYSGASADGIPYDHYEPPDDMFDVPQRNPDNQCYCPDGDDECGPDGLQNIAPCQFDAPVYLSYPHFYKSDPALLESVEGLSPDPEKHRSYFNIQPKLGVPLEGQVRVQLNIKVDHAPNIHVVKKFPSIILPIVWVQEGVADLTPPIKRLIYLATNVADVAGPLFSYGCIVFGSSILIFIFVKAYKNVVFTRENLERGRETLRRGSSFIINGQHRLLIVRDSYSLLSNELLSQDPDPDGEQDAHV
ncbi:Protein peste [Gryllus bimaculatus]|nr:Protein peste [Gryllus bimaculatus]